MTVFPYGVHTVNCKSYMTYLRSSVVSVVYNTVVSWRELKCTQ